jgi:hypothetical protein
MRKRVFAAFAAFLLSFLVPSVACANPADSVYPLQMVRVDVSEDAMAVEGALVNICTVTSINEEKHFWLGVAHCFADENPRYIMGDVVSVVMRDVKNDIAIVHTPRASAPAVPLATVAPKVKDIIWMTGYPLGWQIQVTTGGNVAAIDVDNVIFNITAARGNSGSAILNENGEIVSILQTGYGDPRFFAIIMGGERLDVLEAYRSYWE